MSGLTVKGPKWLSNAVFYQIYPQSFQDSNGDGIGDFQGIIDRLDYIESLGCNAIWINPCFESPFQDAGYDVADFYKVAPRYGTLADLKRLFREANKRNIRVVLDLVPGHTSIEHPWFKASCSPNKNKYTDRYIWTNHAMETPPKPFRGIQGYCDRDGAYIINFFWCQPSLNFGFANPDPAHPWQQPVDAPGPKAVRREIMKIMRYWLDMGAAGFRVDMASSLVKNDPGFKQTSAFWQEVRAMLERHYPEAVLISEWSNPKLAINKAGFHIDFLLPWAAPGYEHLFRDHELIGQGPDIHDHSYFCRHGRGDITKFLNYYLDHFLATKNKGYISIISGNHDIGRIRRYRTIREVEVVMAFILTMPGVPFLYYGDEIGMNYLENMTSVEGGYPRTGSRTPMQWDSSKNAGFSTASKDKLYAPLDPAANRPTVEKQQKQKNSLLNLVRELIALRKSSYALSSDGGFNPVYGTGQRRYPFVYLRTYKRDRYLVAVNPTDRSLRANFPAVNDTGRMELHLGRDVTMEKRAKLFRLEMGPFSYGIYKA